MTDVSVENTGVPGLSAGRLPSAARHTASMRVRGGGTERRRAPGLLGPGAVVGLAYIGAALLGFQLAVVAEQVTTVWAPTGIALAALILGGLRLWPAIWIAAFLVNAVTDAPTWTAFVIATGNTCEAVAAAWVLRRIPAFDLAFRKVDGVLAFGGVAVLLCTTVSATAGAGILCAAGVEPWERFGTLWFHWWLGDALGALIVAPAVVTAAHGPWSGRDLAKASAFAGGAMAVTYVVFGDPAGLGTRSIEFVVLPVAIAAAVVGGPAVTSLVVLGVSSVAIWQTSDGSGPFAGADVGQGLVLLQVFMGVLAGTALLLAAAIAERETTEGRERDAARALRHREQMLTLAQQAGGVATFEWDFRRQVAHCSPEFFRIFGLTFGGGVITALEWARFVHPDDRDRMSAHLARALAGDEPARADYRIVAADGRIRWLTYAGQVQTTPAGDRMLGTVLDVTSRMEAAAALRESRDVLSLAMRGGGMGAWSRNLTTNEVWWSRELEEIVGLGPGAFSGTEHGFFELVHDDDRQPVRKAVEAAIEHRSDYIVEFRFRHASGEWRWMEGRGRAVYGEDGAPRTLYGIGIDVTARKQGELALREAKGAAESASQLKDQFLATLSHELRTPLNAILGYARMLQTDTIPREKREHAIDVIERNAIAQARLVEDLLDMSRITTGRIRLDTAPVAAATVLQEALEGLKPAADAKGIHLDTDIDPDAGHVSADSTRLQQVFWNVLTNAVKFTEPGGRITVSLRGERRFVEASIRDTGAGIAPGFLPFIFEPFRQADAGFNRRHGGMGLGLAIARQLVELHGGTIHASSPGIGEGATFAIRLPRVSDGAEAAAS